MGVEPTNTADIALNKKINTIKKSLNLKLAKKIVKKYSKFDFIVATNFFAQTNNLDEIIIFLNNPMKYFLEVFQQF